MKFQFCGHINCPEWFIAQISVLTKITAVKIKLIFSQLITYYLESSDVTAKITKLLNGIGFDQYQMYSVIATLKFILENSITFNVNDTVLNKQLIDLGLPKQNVESITKTFKSNKQKLMAKASQKMLKTTGDLNIKFSIHEFLASSKIGSINNINLSKKNIQFAQIKLSIQNKFNRKNQTHNFIATSQQLDYAIFELQSALQTVQKLQRNDLKKIEKGSE